MFNQLKVVICFLVLALFTLTDSRAQTRGGEVGQYFRIAAKCEKFKATADELRKAGYGPVKNSAGKITMFSFAGMSGVIEYSNSTVERPTAITIAGRRLDMTANPSVDEVKRARQHVKTKLKLYRHIVSLCGIKKPVLFDFIERDIESYGASYRSVLLQADDDGEPSIDEWMDPFFWSDYWEQEIPQQLVEDRRLFENSCDWFGGPGCRPRDECPFGTCLARPCSQSLDSCIDSCDSWANFGTAGFCPVIGVLAAGATGGNVLVGAIASGACIGGTESGRTRCRNECREPCIPGR